MPTVDCPHTKIGGEVVGNPSWVHSCIFCKVEQLTRERDEAKAEIDRAWRELGGRSEFFSVDLSLAVAVLKKGNDDAQAEVKLLREAVSTLKLALAETDRLVKLIGEKGGA